MTAQTPDGITYQEKGFPLLSTPFKSYPEYRKFIQRSPANERGYLANWEISGGRLYLTGFSGAARYCRPVTDATLPKPLISHNGEYLVQEIGLRDLFGADVKKVFANWYTGRLILPQGIMIEFIDERYKSRYETYLIIAIIDGVEMATCTISYWEIEEQQRRGREGLIDLLEAMLRKINEDQEDCVEEAFAIMDTRLRNLNLPKWD